MSWEDILGGIGKIAGAALSLAAFRNTLTMERDIAIQEIISKVQNLPAAQLDEYEVEFIKNSLNLHDQQERIRAMELYAILKIAEYNRYEKFRGFSTPGGRLG